MPARRATAALALLAATVCAPAAAAPAPPPAADAPYWVNPDGKAARAAAAHRAAGRTAEAALLDRIATRPVAEWIGTDRPEAKARAVTEAATKAARASLLVLYDIPHRDCGLHSAGGAPDGEAYLAWVDAVARGIGPRRATVVLEPDAVMHVVDGCTPAQHHDERYALLEAAVERLQRQSGTTVHLDAGNPGWAAPEKLAEPLRRAGIAAADGFAVNVSNFRTTEESVAYGRELSALVGGKPFVVDTSRNGNGPYTEGDPAENWCNPPGRALGEPPTLRTGDPLVRAHLWIKRPGESDGECRGGPRAGEWFDSYALELARNAR
ncbi:glycoside hydrolase family 6 protein [Streptomyces roseolus]|uniref:glycoside hydrolase family 6 protein n=1 Tax=Streptomyces roseolus TaxID=67358 RepID=UPI0016790E28|nr:glycoside hydrolase family 6 protein [Streptomyces roseolus]GGR22144.1 glucanase [Streptomyces roseolus]